MNIVFSGFLRSRRGVFLGVAGIVAGAAGFMLYEPPAPYLLSEKYKAAALGDLEGDSSCDTAFFRHVEDFAPVPPPGPRDWLAGHYEGGQTYAAFLRGRYNQLDGVNRKIYFQPIALTLKNKAEYLDALKEFAGVFFGADTAVLPELELSSLKAASRINPRTGKRQLQATDILKALKPHIPQDAFCVLGVTMEDIYPDDAWNYASGFASFTERVGVYSFFRYSEDFFKVRPSPEFNRLFLLRSIKVLSHETSHMFGLAHCIYYKCIENGFNYTEEMDSRPLILCPICLRKLQHGAGFDIASRYESLEKIYRRHGFTIEADWIASRLKKVRQRAPAPGR